MATTNEKQLVLKIRFLVGFFILSLVVWGVSLSCDFFMAGSYPYAECYEFNITQEKLIEKVNIFKEENPAYKLFTYNKENREEVLDHYTEYFYHIYFYFADINQTIHCIITKYGSIGVDAMSEGVNFGDWKNINTKDLSKKENKEIKKKFETEILDKLGEWKPCK
jgi:hypothetical protein